jgi:hypothetical protein
MTRSRSSKALSESEAAPPAADPLAASRTLLAALTRPAAMASWSERDWDLAIRQARRSRLLPRLALDAGSLGLDSRIPKKAADMLAAERYAAAEHARYLSWEIGRVRRVFEGLGHPLILLKGAAYAAAGLPPARGRPSNDLDILVPEDALAEVEAALIAHGWRHVELSDYAQSYYRDWMHELPPLRHALRGTVIDVHHTILPRTGRVRPNARRLIADAVATPIPGAFVLAPGDMVLHSAAHLFQDGHLHFAIRDLVDLADLMRHFGEDAAFWDRLVARAALHDLGRPLFYAVRYATLLLGLEVPKAAQAAIGRAAPPGLVLRLMDRLAPRALLPGDPDVRDTAGAPAALLLYMRSHWLRMPPWMLAAHLVRQASIRAYAAALKRMKKEREAE